MDLNVYCTTCHFCDNVLGAEKIPTNCSCCGEKVLDVINLDELSSESVKSY